MSFQLWLILVGIVGCIILFEPVFRWGMRRYHPWAATRIALVSVLIIYPLGVILMEYTSPLIPIVILFAYLYIDDTSKSGPEIFREWKDYFFKKLK